MPKLTYSKAPREYPTSQLYELRRKLKMDIYHRRRIPGESPYCPICKEKITIEGGADLHEVFFTRGDVQGVRDQENHDKIFHRCNVVLVHNGDCHLTAQHTPDGSYKCVFQIVLYEGKLQVLESIDQMRSILRVSTAADFEKERVIRIADELGQGTVPEPRWNFS